MSEVEPTGRILIWIFLGFIIALNLGLIFAYRDRNKIQPPRPTRHNLLKNRDADAASELARRVAALREPPPEPHPSEATDQQNKPPSLQ